MARRRRSLLSGRGRRESVSELPESADELTEEAADEASTEEAATEEVARAIEPAALASTATEPPPTAEGPVPEQSAPAPGQGAPSPERGAAAGAPLPEAAPAAPAPPASTEPAPTAPPAAQEELPPEADAPPPPRHVESGHQVFERSGYVDHGTGVVEDTTDSGWDEDASDLSIPEPPPGFGDPSMATGGLHPALRSSTVSEARRGGFADDEVDQPSSYYPGFGHLEDEAEAPTVRFSGYATDEAATRLADAGQFDDLGDFADGPSGPPTDEVPSAMLQDVSQSYSAPMNVPEPPPLPGILDDFDGPAGAPAQPASSRRPSYLAETPEPAPVVKPPPPARLPPEPAEQPPRVLPIALVSAIVLAGFGAVVVALLGYMFWQNRDDGEPPAPAPAVQPAPAEASGTVEGRGGIRVRTQRSLRDEEATGDTPPALDDDPPTPAPTPEPAPTPSTAPSRPRPAPSPAPTVQDALPATATMAVRSNRQVIVQVDGKTLGLTPTTYRGPSGTFTVSAMLPGQPDSQQVKTVTVGAGKSVSVDFAF